MECSELAMKDDAAVLDNTDEALTTCDFSDEALENAARVDGRPAITVGYWPPPLMLGTVLRIDATSLQPAALSLMSDTSHRARLLPLSNHLTNWLA